MVLNKSKWDRKAKFQYLKKHGIVPVKVEEAVKPKWSGKTSKDNTSRVILEDSDDEWDDADDALLKHFYPLLGEELTEAQKLKLKQQILEEVEKDKKPVRAEDDESVKADAEEDEDGIYLGTKPDEVQTSTLDELITASTLKPRKFLSNKLSENFLDEYGIDNYSKLVKDDDYKYLSKTRNVNDIPAEELNGFVIGESLLELKPYPTKGELSEKDKEENVARLEKVEQQRLYNQIRGKFAPATKSKVLEINNIRDTDYLHNRIVDSGKGNITDDQFNDDLNALGIDVVVEGNEKVEKGSIDDLLSLSRSVEVKKEKKKVVLDLPDVGKSFLDDLLGDT